MKKINKILILSACLFGFMLAFSQKVTTQAIEKPSEGKSLVYIAKTGAGPLVNFRIYDNDKFLGALSGMKYMVYETEPGEHLFWATSENRDFVKATLEPNAVYVLNAEGQMGAFIAGVNLKPMNPQVFQDKRLFYQIIKSLKKQTTFNTSEDKTENIKKGLEKYEELKNSNSSKVRILEASWKFENADKPAREN